MSIVVAPITPGPSTSSATKAAATPGSSTDTTGGANGTSTGSQLTQADFLQIMVAQFENEDPLSSSDGSGSSSGTSDYVNELMSMTNLTTMQTMSNQQSMMLAGSLPGSTVVVNNNGTDISGVVSNASIQNATLYITVNGTQYPASDLIAITQTQAQAQAASSSSSNSTSNSAYTGTPDTTGTTPTPSS